MSVPAQPAARRRLAEWVLGRLASETVPEIAVEALQSGCESSAVAVLAGLNRPTRREIEDELPGLLRELGCSRPTELEAMKLLIDECAAGIVAGTFDPVSGAERIWELSGWGDRTDGYPEAWLDVRPFIGVASEAENDRANIELYAAGAAREARTLLARGGLTITPGLGAGQLDGRVVRRTQLQEHVLDGVRTPVRLGLEFEDGLFITYACAADARSLELGYRQLHAYDLGTDGLIEIREQGHPCDLLPPGTVVRAVSTVVGRLGASVGIKVDAASGVVYVFIQDERLTITEELPASMREL